MNGTISFHLGLTNKGFWLVQRSRSWISLKCKVDEGYVPAEVGGKTVTMLQYSYNARGQLFFVELACLNPELDGFDWHHQASVHCSKQCCQYISATSREKLSRTPRIEPGVALCQGRTISIVPCGPLCQSFVWVSNKTRFAIRSGSKKRFRSRLMIVLLAGQQLVEFSFGRMTTKSIFSLLIHPVFYFKTLY